MTESSASVFALQYVQLVWPWQKIVARGNNHFEIFHHINRLCLVSVRKIDNLILYLAAHYQVDKIFVENNYSFSPCKNTKMYGVVAFSDLKKQQEYLDGFYS